MKTPLLCLISTLYPVITEPPSAGANQVIETFVSEIEVVGAVGVEGAVAGSTAPFPELDASEGPKSLMAITLA